MNIKEHVEKVESENVQTLKKRIEQNGEQIMKKKLQKLHVQRKIWRGHNIIF
jgi:N-methylhydantoinase B/oxoprolinase/acetone carboxylase alpha subunit